MPSLTLYLHPCAGGEYLPLASGIAKTPSMACHCRSDAEYPAMFPVGTVLYSPSIADGNPLLKVTGYTWLPHVPHALRCPLLTAQCDITLQMADKEVLVETKKQGHALAWITLSDKGSAGQREDKSGPAIAELAAGALPLCHSQGFMIPDDANTLRALLTDLALNQGYDIICTTGGTGLSSRDITPQVTSALLDAALPGFSQAMLLASLAKTPHAAISRAVAGVMGQSIIINLPGSRKAVLENLAAVLPALPHALDKLHGDPADCGG